MPNYGHLSLSCAKIERPSPLKKPSCKVRFFAQNRSRKYRQKVTVTTLFPTVSHPDFQLLSQTAHVRSHSRKWVHTRPSEKNRTQEHTRRNRGLPSPGHSAAYVASEIFLFRHAFIYIHFPVHCDPSLSAERKIRRNCRHKFYPQPFLIPVFNFSHKRPTFAFTGKSGYTLGFRRKIAHKGTHGETGGVLDGGAVTTLGPFRTFINIPGPGIRTAYFAAFGAWSGAPKERRKPSEQRCAYARRCSEASRPRWAA